MAKNNPTSAYLRLETRIAADERGGVVHRWQYGRKLLEAKAGRKKLPDGLLDDLVTAAVRAGLKLSRQEIQRRIRCAEVYENDRALRRACDAIGSWRDLVNAGFPCIAPDEPDDLEAAGLSTGAPDEFEQLSLIPGLQPVLSVRGRRVPLGEATIADVAAYHDVYAQIHDNYGKRLVLIKVALEAMRIGADGDEQANAVRAWRAGTGREPGVMRAYDPDAYQRQLGVTSSGGDP